MTKYWRSINHKYINNVELIFNEWRPTSSGMGDIRLTIPVRPYCVDQALDRFLETAGWDVTLGSARFPESGL